LKTGWRTLPSADFARYSISAKQKGRLNLGAAMRDALALGLGIRVDAGNWNNSGTANPAIGAGGISISSLNAGPYFAAISQHDTTEVSTANFGATAYAETVPAGFGNW
jgi:hypothetical protein